MQKVIQRAALVRRQATRKAATRKSKWRSDERTLLAQERGALGASMQGDIQAARAARREDWLLGPLAPRRDAGDAKETYGTVSTRRVNGVKKEAGTEKDWCIEVGDRVAIVEKGHRERGKIGKVQRVEKKAEVCYIEGLNRVDVTLPEYMLNSEDQSRLATLEAPLPLSSVRLVYALEDAKTGTLRDHVIEALTRGRNFVKDSEYRYVAGANPRIEIPWPEKEPEVHEDHDIDTLRIEVEDRTWVPSLIRPPMPLSVIDELRNKYSKFRDRHDHSYVVEKVKEEIQQSPKPSHVIQELEIKYPKFWTRHDLRSVKSTVQRNVEMKERKMRARSMMTPLQELHRKERAEKKARGRPVLSEDMLARVGKIMVTSGPGSVQRTRRLRRPLKQKG